MRLGPHCLFGSSEATRIVSEGKAPVIKLVDDWGWADGLSGIKIGRKTAPEELRLYNPAQRYRDGANPLTEARRFLYSIEDCSGWSLADNIEDNTHVTAWEGPNEPVFGTGEEMRWYADFEAERARILRQELGIGAVVGNFSVGTPADLALWNYFSPAIGAVLIHDGYLGLHEYWN